MPTGRYSRNGAIIMDARHSTMPKRFAMVISCASVRFLLEITGRMSRVNSVMELFSTELNEDRIAPNMTAAKKPSTGVGRMSLIRDGYAISKSVSTPPSRMNWITPGATRKIGQNTQVRPVSSEPFCASFRFFAPSTRCMMDWLVHQ